MEEVKKWLSELRISRFENKFECEGYDDMEDIRSLSPEEIEEMIGDIDIKCVEDCNRIRHNLKKKKKEKIIISSQSQSNGSSKYSMEQRVEVCDDNNIWQSGIVTEDGMNPKVKPDGWGESYAWKQIRSRSTAAADVLPTVQQPGTMDEIKKDDEMIIDTMYKRNQKQKHTTEAQDNVPQKGRVKALINKYSRKNQAQSLNPNLPTSKDAKKTKDVFCFQKKLGNNHRLDKLNESRNASRIKISG